jgi:hypothetical protein
MIATRMLTDLRSAGRFISSLPYARSSNPDEPLTVLIESRGTCSTKHALLSRLAAEQGLDIALVLGIYEMSECNTPEAGCVLAKYGLTSLPEAHCYLRADGNRIDVTRGSRRIVSEPTSEFLCEQDIDTGQISSFKVHFHQRFLASWICEKNLERFCLSHLWRIREECIAALRSRFLA